MTSGGPAFDMSDEDSEGSRIMSDPIEQAMTDLRVAGERSAPKQPTWRRVVAALVHDSQHDRPIVGARSVGTEQRRLLFASDSIEIDLEIGQSRMAGRLRMLGQVTADAPGLAVAWVVAEGASGHLETEVDDLGQFSLDGLVSGVHRMEIGLAYELIEIPAIQF